MKELYAQRRAKLMENKPSPSMICIFSGKAPMRSADEGYNFVVDRSFYYLTGIDRENMVLVLQKSAFGDYSESLYIEPYDEVMAKWVGGKMRAPEAREISGVETINYSEDFKPMIVNTLERNRGMGKYHLYLDLWKYDVQQSDTQSVQFGKWLRREYPAVEVEEIYGDLTAMRAVKSEEELEQMRKAIEYTKNAVIAMWKYTKPGMNETEIEGRFDFELMKQGCREHAFPTICAGGKRATTLHYGDNNNVVEDGTLILTDLGGAHNHYCADISRTYPANGKFTERQKEIYNTVLEAQRIMITSAKPGMTMTELNQLVIDYYESRLDDLGLRKNGKGVRDYYYHSVTHSLGLDTHDVCTLKERTIQAGMVITAEPGLYIEDEGIGIRIEDDILITENGAIVLSQAIPKTVEDIERIMSER